MFAGFLFTIPQSIRKSVLVLVMNETLLENNIVSLRLNYLLSTRQFIRDAFIYSTFGFVKRRFVNVNSGRLWRLNYSQNTQRVPLRIPEKF